MMKVALVRSLSQREREAKESTVTVRYRFRADQGKGHLISGENRNRKTRGENLHRHDSLLRADEAVTIATALDDNRASQDNPTRRCSHPETRNGTCAGSSNSRTGTG